MYGLPQGCPSAPLAFSLAMASPEDEFFRRVAETKVNPKSVITLIVAPESADTCFEALSQALTEAGMKLNVDKCIAWTTDGHPPDTPRARALWNQAKDHRGFIACGFPATFEHPEFAAPLAFPMGSPDNFDDFPAARGDSLER